MIFRNILQPIKNAVNKPRVFGLDLLRAVAITLVLYGHCVLLFGQEGRAILFKFMFLDPVTLFFVLSGFLIGKILLDTFEFEKLNFKTLFHFWLRRWMRTVPAYLATLLLLAFVYRQFDIRLLLRYVFFVQNFNWNHPQWFTEAWSLSIEEWFYFLIPSVLLLTFFLARQNVSKAFFITCFSVILIIPFYRWYRYETTVFTSRTEWDFLFRMQVLSRLDSLMYGVLGACVFRFRPSLWFYNKKLFLILGLLLIAIAWKVNYGYIEREAFYSSVMSFSVESFAVLLIMPFFSDMKIEKGIMAKAVTTLSVISYSLYLLNMSFVSLYVCYVIPQPGLEGDSLLTYKVAVYWIVTFVTATALYILVEHPFMYLRDRISKVYHAYKSRPEAAWERRSAS